MPFHGFHLPIAIMLFCIFNDANNLLTCTFLEKPHSGPVNRLEKQMDNGNLCGHCSKRVQKFCFKIKFINCLKLYHHQCVNLSRDDIEQIQDWYCQKFIQTLLSFNSFDDDNDFQCCILAFCVDHPIRFHTLNNQVLVQFELNDVTDTPMFEVK